MKKLNLGCGPSGINGWINYDWGLLPMISKYKMMDVLIRLKIMPIHYQQEWPEFELVDIRKLWPLEDGSVDFVYCSQVLEHFELDEAEKILSQVRRVLKTGGLFRLSVPDAQAVIKKYLEDNDIWQLNESFWGYNKYEYDRSWLGRIKRIFIRGHQWMYDKALIKKMLQKHGFTDIRMCKCGQGKIPDLKKIDFKGHEKTSMYVEAVSNGK